LLRRRRILGVRRFARALFLLLALGAVPATSAPAAGTPDGMTVDVDTSEVRRGIVHVRETIPVGGGPLTLVYPKWLPGEHSPNGPIVNLTSSRSMPTERRSRGAATSSTSTHFTSMCRPVRTVSTWRSIFSVFRPGAPRRYGSLPQHVHAHLE
jgi:hypothetical protein